MAISTYPAATGGGIKSVQRGSAGGAGNVTITAVDITKSFVNVFGTSSSGTVVPSFGMSIGNGNVALIGNHVFIPNTAFRPVNASNMSSSTGGESWSATVASNIGGVTVNAGSNNLVAAQITGFLANSTTLTVSGACRWEVVEFN